MHNADKTKLGNELYVNYTDFKTKKMRTLLLITLMMFLLNSCSEQQTKPKDEKIYSDILNLPEPKSYKEETIASPQDYNHCIDLTQNDYGVVINGTKYAKPNEEELAAFIKINRKDIIKQKLNIITDTLTAFKKTINILDILYVNKISNYKVVSVSINHPKA